jgi:hypothetical protein
MFSAVVEFHMRMSAICVSVLVSSVVSVRIGPFLKEVAGLLKRATGDRIGSSITF